MIGGKHHLYWRPNVPETPHTGGLMRQPAGNLFLARIVNLGVNDPMTHDATELFKRALALTAEERAELAGSLLDSLDGAEDDPEAVEAAWNEEIAGRIADLDSGKAKTIPWEEVRHRISGKLTHGR